MTTKPLTDQTPAEVDAVLSELWQEEARYTFWLASAREDRLAARYPAQIVERSKIVAQYEAKLAELREAARPGEAEFTRRGGWRRYFLVTNAGGHVHRERHCSTCYSTTRYAWLPELSGCVEAEMVAEFGWRACTICFPDAPTLAAFHGPGRREAAEVAARDAEKAAAAAKKAAKAITDVDGRTLLDHSSYPLRTKVAARNELSSLVQYAAFYGLDRYAATIRRLVAALEAAGVETEPVMTRALDKARKEGGTEPVDVAALRASGLAALPVGDVSVF